MSLLTIVKSVMDSNGWPQVTNAVAASTDQNMRQSYALANKALISTAFKKNWPVLVREHTFTTVADQAEYALPDDFHHLIAPSVFDASQYYLMRGALTSLQWYRKVLNGSVDFGGGFRLDTYGGNFVVGPAPTGTDDMVFMYITSDIVQGAGIGPTMQTRYTADTDVALIDEDLVEMGLSWRWRQKKGLEFSAELAEYQGTMNLRYAQQLSYGELPIGGMSAGMAPLTDGAPFYTYGAIGV